VLLDQIASCLKECLNPRLDQQVASNFVDLTSVKYLLPSLRMCVCSLCSLPGLRMGGLQGGKEGEFRTGLHIGPGLAAAAHVIIVHMHIKDTPRPVCIIC